MSEFIGEFDKRRRLIETANCDDAQKRFSAFYEFLSAHPLLAGEVERYLKSVDTIALLEGTDWQNGPRASTPDEVVALGLHFLRIAKVEEADPANFALEHGIRPDFQTSRIPDYFDVMMRNYVGPALDQLAEILRRADASKSASGGGSSSYFPPEITESFQRFQQDHGGSERNAFVMMRFGKTKRHEEIIAAIRSTLSEFGINAHRADDKGYHDDLFPNVLTYIYGCRFGIAVFERLEADEFNPNISLEVGYMRALNKPICLLKDSTLKTLHTDLVGKLYKQFDPQNPVESVPPELTKWLRDKGIVPQ